MTASGSETPTTDRAFAVGIPQHRIKTLVSEARCVLASASFIVRGQFQRRFSVAPEALSGWLSRYSPCRDDTEPNELIGQGGGRLFGHENCGPVGALKITKPTEGILELR
jgi:hypothetical protein